MTEFASKFTYLFVTALVTLGLGNAGCALEQQDGALEQGEKLTADDGVATKAWTGWTSEEFPPLLCADQRLIHGAECYASYCDYVRLDCVPVSGTFGDSSWSTYFSDDDSDDETNFRKCGSNEWVTGIDCNGSYCDNLSIECTRVTGRSVGACSWSEAISEEDGPLQLPINRYVRGVKCEGDFCDRMSYYHCQLL